MIEPIHPWMLAGTAVGSAPVIIHLLNRQRYKKVTWAAMHWLLAAFKKSARRLQIEDLILLIIRILILVLLALALARMVMHEGGFLGIGGKSELHRVVVLDTSFSMGYSPGGKTCFDRAKEVARQLASKTELSPGDKVTLVAMTDQAGVRVKASSDINAVYRDVDSTELSEAGTNVPMSLAKALRLLAESTSSPRREIFLITDMTRCGWLEVGGANDGKVRNLDELKKAVAEYKNANPNRGLPPVYLIDVGVKDAQNAAVVGLESDTPIIAAKSLVAFKARVQNNTDKDLNDLSVALSVDGERVSSALIQKIAAGREGSVSFSYQFETAGPHWVSAGIEPDRLSSDDRRPMAVPVIESLKLLAVDGEIKSTALESETGLLLRVLAPKVPQHLASQGVRSPSIISPSVISDEGLPEAQLEGLDMVVLANVPAVNENKAAQLRRFVREGGALLIFVGDRVDPELYNEMLFAGDDPLLPAKLTVTQGEAGRNDAPFVSLQPDTAADAFLPNVGRSFRSLFRNVRVFKRYRCEVAEPAKAGGPTAAPKPPDPAGAAEAAGKGGPAAGAKEADGEKGKDGKKEAPVASTVHVPLRYDNGEAAIVVREYGQGKVALVTTTADKYWNDLPEHGVYLPLMHELVYHLVRPRGARHNLEVGGRFSIPWPPEDMTKEVSVIPPEGREAEKTSKRPDSDGTFSYAGPQDSGVRWAGAYKLLVVGEDRPREIFAAQMPAAESNLARIEADEVSKSVKEPAFLVISDPDKLGETIKGRVVGREFWRTLAWTVLVLAVAETFLAWFFGRNRW